MKKKLLLFLIIYSIVISYELGAQLKSKIASGKGERVSTVTFNKNEYQNVTPIQRLSERPNYNLVSSSMPNSPQAWVNIVTENFEGSLPGPGWNIYAQSGFTNAYWGKLLLGDNVHYGGWCAASGTQASVWGAGYRDNMRAWMIYGPFDLSDATDASLDFLCISDCEPGFDNFGWYASLDGSNFNGYVLSDTTTNYQFQSKTFDLKSVPTLGNTLGHNSVYIAFLFISDSTISFYNGAVIDEIVLRKFIGTSYPTNIAISKSYNFNDVTQSSSYRMIGLPGQTNFAIPVTGTRKTDWNVFYDNGAASNYLIEYDGTTNFNFKPGNGFWLLSKNAININAQVNSVPLTGDSTYSIPLHSGWNIISNPFERSTNWSAVQFANLLAGNGVIYDWGGSWTNPSLFSPYKAYYFNNVNNQTNLWIPYDPSGILGKVSDENTLQIAGEGDIKLILISEGEEKSKAFIGYNSESTNDFDNQDYFAPPGDFEDARIVIRNSNLSTDYKYLMKESRSEIGEGQIYDLEIKNLTGVELICKVEGITKYQNYSIYLLDERLNNSTKLSDNMELSISANTKLNKYRLFIGTQQFIEANIGNHTPTAFYLYQNYPNPFNPATIIRYSIPAESKVTIKIFDLLGNEVLILSEGVKSPGNYELELNASVLSRLASGIYVYQLQAGSFTDSKKMILLR